jgi:hypothetical protein
LTALLKAVAQKLIPGIPIPTRISLLQQTASDGSGPEDDKSAMSQLSVLEEVIDRATSRNEIQREIDGEPHDILNCVKTLTSAQSCRKGLITMTPFLLLSGHSVKFNMTA